MLQTRTRNSRAKAAVVVSVSALCAIAGSTSAAMAASGPYDGSARHHFHHHNEYRHHRHHEYLNPEDSDSKDSNYKDRDSKDTDPEGTDPKDSNYKDRDSKDTDPEDSDSKDSDSKDSDSKDSDPKDTDLKDSQNDKSHPNTKSDLRCQESHNETYCSASPKHRGQENKLEKLVKTSKTVRPTGDDRKLKAKVFCPSGWVASGGGFTTRHALIKDSNPTVFGEGWKATAVALKVRKAELTARVVCIHEKKR